MKNPSVKQINMETLRYLDRRQSDGNIDIKTGVCPFINWSTSVLTAE